MLVVQLPDGGHAQGRVPEVVLEAEIAAGRDCSVTLLIQEGQRRRPARQLVRARRADQATTAASTTTVLTWLRCGRGSRVIAGRGHFGGFR